MLYTFKIVDCFTSELHEVIVIETVEAKSSLEARAMLQQKYPDYMLFEIVDVKKRVV